MNDWFQCIGFFIGINQYFNTSISEQNAGVTEHPKSKS